ncbi:MAG: hypothetical protein IKB34_03125 [Clostridia bacterium]|nr:hypothetical protein [Clostridia bacterium]
MFWNKKKKQDYEDDQEEIVEEEIAEDESDVCNEDGGNEGAEHAAAVESKDDVAMEKDSEREEENAEQEDSEEDVAPPTRQVLYKVNSLEQLATFANKRGNGVMQFMAKDTCEVFELREAHFRIAQVWGTVTMARECSADEYSRVMLAMEIIDHEENYYSLPGLTEKEVCQAIEDFCRDNFSVNGKKFSRKPEKFTKLLKENDRREDWDEYTKSLVYDKLEAFCEKNGISFATEEDAEVLKEEEMKEDGSDS